METMSSFVRHMTSSFNVTDLKRNIFGRAIPSFNVIPLILLELPGEDLGNPVTIVAERIKAQYFATY